MKATVLEQVHAVTFDVGGTLLRPWPSVGHIYAEIAERHGHRGLNPETLNRRFAAAWRARQGFCHTRKQWAALVEDTFQGSLAPGATRSFFADIYERFAQPPAWHIFDDVLPALQWLAARGLKLGILSNWDERLRPLLRSLKLEKYFDAIVISCEAGATKPSSKIFAQAAARLGLPPETILHVGDDLRMDVRGARAAGFQACRLERSARKRTSGEIKSLGELCAPTYMTQRDR